MTVLIPAYKPDQKMITLIKQIKSETSYDILVIDDGSGNEFAEIFKEAESLGCCVLANPVNKGKGYTIKYGFSHLVLEKSESHGVVTADADGQHTVSDIVKIADAITDKNTMILGGREFSKDIPFRSRFGNIVTRNVFKFVFGKRINDTQSGLRGFPVEILPAMIEIKGDRYEYEMNMLIGCVEKCININEISIETIYIEDNASSHFHPVRDSIKIYSTILKYCSAALISWLIDYSLLILLNSLTENLLLPIIISRGISMVINFILNKKTVFKIKGNSVKTFTKYVILVGVNILMSWLFIKAMNVLLFIPVAVAKLISDLVLYVMNFYLQRKIVFKRKPKTQKID